MTDTRTRMWQIVAAYLHMAYLMKSDHLRGSIQNILDWPCSIIKLNIRPIGRHHPRSSSLPHVDTGPTITIFGNRKRSQGAKSGEYGRWGMTVIFCFASNFCMRTEVWDGTLSWWSSQVCSRQSSGQRLRRFSHSRSKTRNSQLSCWDRCFALPQLLYRWRHQSRIFWIPFRICR
jgi:hypothetical protein